MPTIKTLQEVYNLNNVLITSLPPTENKPSEHPSQSEATDAVLLLRYHYQYGHISFQRLKKMAEQKVIPRRLKDIPTPA